MLIDCITNRLRAFLCYDDTTSTCNLTIIARSLVTGSLVSLTGYETVIAPVLKRLIAELIDIILFALLLKAYMPELDYRFACHLHVHATVSIL